MIRLLTAGETHGKAVLAVLEGFPSNVPISIDCINKELKIRQEGYGRGGRMAIESDKASVLSGIRGGYSLGSPITVMIENKDYSNWESYMNESHIAEGKEVYMPRPGHADLSGYIKYDHKDIRNVLERASARETAARVASGSICKQFLSLFGISVLSHVTSIGSVNSGVDSDDIDALRGASGSVVRFASPDNEKAAIAFIDKAKEKGESVGGSIQVVVTGVPVGLGSYTQYDRKLDAIIAANVISVQAVKSIEFGIGSKCGKELGSKVHDEIIYEGGLYKRATNNAGGIEGGMSNGENIIFSATMKPIPTLYKPLKSVDVRTKKEVLAEVERSDICAVPACSVVLEAVTAFAVTSAFLDKFGGDSLGEIRANYDGYIKRNKLK